ncbi:hypothetical protein EAH72_05060 [Pseudomonas caspiana]|nr:LuxR C-terminal-related transcriptional regulator [Pseudomonas caspiana]TPG98295.1 hypothetical protein EAH72_05060 [Pseudomonas caspiana]
MAIHDGATSPHCLRQKLTEEKIEALLQAGLDQKNIAKNLELSPATVSRYCKKIREKNHI